MSNSIETVGIIGSGTMGNGIAQACASNGIRVVLVDIQQAAIDKGLATIASSLDRLIKKEKITAADKAQTLSRIHGSTQFEDLKGAQLVIEAATENEALKIKILQQLDGLLPADVIVATNTSSISITKLAAATQRADRFVGMHFFNPVPMMALVEIIRGLQTSDATHDAVKALAERLGKTPITVKNAPGFVVNRILVPMRRHRRRHETRHQPAHRPAGPGRHDRAGRVPRGDERLHGRIQRQQVPPGAAAEGNGGRRLAGPQEWARRVHLLIPGAVHCCRPAASESGLRLVFLRRPPNSLANLMAIDPTL